LNAAGKLFSRASADYSAAPNAVSWPFDLAVPGSQPVFQPTVLIPALRAALALNCQIQHQSKFDRKHYFYHDQPAGYQITQYYEPFAKNGLVKLSKLDDSTIRDDIEVGIKQVQLEQDTARSQEQDDEAVLVDFNRSGLALIEIISLPHIHSPEAASAYVRKVQSILYAVDSTTTGMELGGLRADVNVSVRRPGNEAAKHSYSGITGLGQRTEIKNLSSFKAVEDAVRAERDRQIAILENGGIVEGETRGWSLASPHETRRLRGKEGEVDYRYMPDPDIQPLHIGPDLIGHLQSTLPPVPAQLREMIMCRYELSLEDAEALLSLDDGARLLYFQDVVSKLSCGDSMSGTPASIVAGNWILHELGAMLTKNNMMWHANLMADLVDMVLSGQLTGTSAKCLLENLFNHEVGSARSIAEKNGLLFVPMTTQEYHDLAQKVIDENVSEAEVVRSGEKRAKGQMMRNGNRSRIEAQKAESVLQSKLVP
ncbi:hypothetical protein LTR66_017842, partial [Elasticomyces elasticus]